MGLPRRFLNLIVEKRSTPGAKSLRRIDMTRQHFFNTTTTPQAAAALKMGRIRLPSPSFNFRAAAWSSSLEEEKQQMHCFPAGDGRVVCADQSGLCFLADAEMRRVAMMPRLHEPKSSPLSLFVPGADDDGGGGGSLFVMESAPEPEPAAGQRLGSSHQFEAFVCRKPTPFYCSKSWESQPLPPPPFVCGGDPNKIRSYAVVGGGSHICISVEGSSYLLDTARYAWSHERSWTLPFHGKVEYVPELKLWFGLSAEDQSTLAAADLANMDSSSSQPQLVGTWKEATTVNLPEEWQVSQDPQLVSLGLGRFCIARFFRARIPSDQNCAVLTGVEMVPASRVHGANANEDGRGGSGSSEKVDLQMITHKSRRYTSNGTDGAINTVF